MGHSVSVEDVVVLEDVLSRELAVEPEDAVLVFPFGFPLAFGVALAFGVVLVLRSGRHDFANDRLKRGEAANQYSSFDDAGDAGGAVGANGSKGVNQLVDKLLDGATASNTSHHFYPQTN